MAKYERCYRLFEKKLNILLGNLKERKMREVCKFLNVISETHSRGYMYTGYKAAKRVKLNS